MATLVIGTTPGLPGGAILSKGGGNHLYEKYILRVKSQTKNYYCKQLEIT